MPLQPQIAGLRSNFFLNALARTAGLRVYVENPFSKNELDIYWTPATALTGHGALLGFNIYRARTPQPDGSSNWTKLNVSPVVVNLFADTTVDMTYQNIWWYRVEEQYFDGTLRDVDQPVNLNSFLNDAGDEPYPDMSVPQIAREKRRRKYIILRRNAELVTLLVRKVAGLRCACFDREYESPQKIATCPQCYGTGWDGGFEVLNNVFMRILSIREMLELQPDGLMLNSDPAAWLVDYPLLRDTDIVVRRNNIRYEVMGADYLTDQGILTEQNFKLRRLESNHVAYTFPLTP